MISSQRFEKALPRIPALSNAETATQVCFFFDNAMLGKDKLEPTIPAVKLAARVFFYKFSSLHKFYLWWAEQGSNLRPIACRAIALPAELSAQNLNIQLK